jgi:hypothetical protein
MQEEQPHLFATLGYAPRKLLSARYQQKGVFDAVRILSLRDACQAASNSTVVLGHRTEEMRMPFIPALFA